MTEKRFELHINPNTNCFDIVDKVESQEKNAICIYNDLGVQYFSSAPALCDLLNELNEENEQLKSKLSKEFPIQDYHFGIHLYCREMTKEELEEQNEQWKRLCE